MEKCLEADEKILRVVQEGFCVACVGWVGEQPCTVSNIDHSVCAPMGTVVAA